MSIALMTKVWERLDVSGGELILALALVDWAEDDGTEIFPSVETLCFKTRQSRRTVQRQLRKLQRIGWLEIVRPCKGGRYRSAEYKVCEAWVNGVNLARLPDLPKLERKRARKGVIDGTKGRHSRHETASPVTPNSSESVNTHQGSSFDTIARTNVQRIRSTVNGLRVFQKNKSKELPGDRLRKAVELLRRTPDIRDGELKRICSLTSSQVSEARREAS